MCEQTEINYLDGDIVWVKLGACWWPGQVTGFHNLPEDIQEEFKKKPLIAAVKFFQEDTYEFVKNYQQIYKYNCTLKDEFIKKGLDKYRSKSKDGSRYMDKFPGDVEMAEKLTGGDPDILSLDKFCPEEKPDISALFGEKKLPKKKRDREDGQRRSDGIDLVRKITHPRFLKESDHEVRIRQQPSSLPSTPNSTGSPQYPCHLCSFTSSRVNVIICHIKSHRSGNSSVARSKVKSFSQHKSRVSDSDTPKRKYVRKEKSQSNKTKTDFTAESGKRKQSKQTEKASKKKKTDPKIRDTILADWDDESDEDLSFNQSKPLDVSSIIDSPIKSQSDYEKSEESNQKNNTVTDNTEIIAEAEKLLKETEKLTSIHLAEDSLTSDISKNFKSSVLDKKLEAEKDLKMSDSETNESIGKVEKDKELSSSDTEGKCASSDKDEKKALLSCFDFHEEEPSIPPVRKKARAFHQKKEIIKEFEMSQALKTEQEKEGESDKADLDVDSQKSKDDESSTDVKSPKTVEDSKDVKPTDESKPDSETGKTEKKNEADPVPAEEAPKKSTATPSETELEIVEIFEVEKAAGETENNQGTTKTTDKVSHANPSVVKKSTSSVSKEPAEDTELNSESKVTDDKQSQPKDNTESVAAESMDHAPLKEIEETLSERFTTETEDETVSESAETLPEQSENSDAEMVDPDHFSSTDAMKILLSSEELNVTPKSVKKRRGRPRKTTETAPTATSGSESLATKVVKSNTKFLERLESERKTSESDTERSSSGRKRKPNKKYLESSIYVQGMDQRSFKNDGSQSESDDKGSEKAKYKSRRNKRSAGVDKKKTEIVEHKEEKKLEPSDRTQNVEENNINLLKVDSKDESSETAAKDKTSTEPEKKFPDSPDRLETTEPLKESKEKEPILKESDSVLPVEDTKLSEIEDKVAKLIEIEPEAEKLETKDVEMETILDKESFLQEDVKEKKIEHTNMLSFDISDKEETTQPDIAKPVVDMLPPKKSQIKKFELSQIDFFDTDASPKKIVTEPDPDNGPDKSEATSTEVSEPIVSQEPDDPLIQEKALPKSTEGNAKAEETAKSTAKEKETTRQIEQTSSTAEEVIRPSETKAPEKQQSETKAPEKQQSETKSENVGQPAKEAAKASSEQSVTKRSSMQTRYKGKFTPETGAKTKKDKDVPSDEKPVNAFQEAFLKTLQMDKKKGTADDSDAMIGKGKKSKKTAKKKAGEEESANVSSAVTQDTKVEDKSEKLELPENTSNIKPPEKTSQGLVMSKLGSIEVVADQTLESDAKVDDPMFQNMDQLASSSAEFGIMSKSLTESPVSEDSPKNLNIDMQKLDESSRMSMSTPSPSSDVVVPVKKREMPRIIENVTLTEPMQILKSKLLDKIPQKGVKHKLESDGTKKGEQKGSPKAKIMKIESLSSNSKMKAGTKAGSSHLSLTKKLQVLKAEEAEAAAIMEAQNEQLHVQTSQTSTTASMPEKYIQQSSQSLADMELDINSMPFVLSDDVLTPESIEQMPVVISSIIPASSTIPATLSFTPTTQMVSGTQGQFKITNESTSEVSPTKKKSGTPAILKNKNKAKPTITSIKTLVPPLTGGVKGIKFQSTQAGKTPPLLTQKGTPGKYVVVQTAGGQQLRYSVQGKTSTQQKIAIPAGKSAGNAQVVQQGGKVVILTSAQSGQTKMLPLNISKTLSGKVQRIMTSKGQMFCPISPQGILTSKTIIAPKADSVSPTTSKLPPGHKIINTQGIITSKGVLTPIPGTIAKTALLGTLSQGILTKGGIYTPISASALGGKTIIGSKTLVTKGATILSSQNLGASKAILTPISQALGGKAILSTQGIVSTKGTVLTPITGQQVKAIAAKSPSKGGKVQYQQVQQKVQLPMLQKSQKLPMSPATQGRSGQLKSSGNTVVLHNAPGHKGIPHGKKIIKQTIVQQGISPHAGTQQTVGIIPQLQHKGKATSTVQKVIIPRGSHRQTKSQQKIVVQKVQEPSISTVQSIHTKQTLSIPSTNVPTISKSIVHQKHASGSSAAMRTALKGNATSTTAQQQKNLLNIAMNSVTATNVNTSLSPSLSLPPLEPLEPEKRTKADNVLVETLQKESKADKFAVEKGVESEKIDEPKLAAQPQIMALPTESSDGTQTYVLVTIDEQGQIQPLDNNTLMSLEGTTQNPDGTRTLYIDPSSLGEAGTLDNIVLQFDNGALPNIQASATEPNQAIISESFPTSEVMQTSNQDILAAALANTDFQQEISLPDNPAGSVMAAGLTQTSLINQTILQSTIIPPTEPISSPSVLETSLTLNQPIMTPLEVPSSLSIQPESTPTSAAVSTIPSSLELPITITNPNISYISAGETQIQIPGNSMPDIGEIMESSPTTEHARTEIPASTQYLVIPNLEDNISVEGQNVQSGAIAMPSVSYSVSIPDNIVLQNPQVQTTPSMPIIDDTYSESVQFSASIEPSMANEQTFADVPVSEMLISKAATTKNVQTQDVTVTSEMSVSHDVPVSTQEPIVSTNEEQDVPMPLQEVPILPEEQLVLQETMAKEDNVSNTPLVTKSDEISNNDSIISMQISEQPVEPMTSSMPILDETAASVSSESNVKMPSEEHMNFEVTESNAMEIDNPEESKSSNKFKDLSFSEQSTSKIHSPLSEESTSTSNEVEPAQEPSQALPAESLNRLDDHNMDIDEAVESKMFAASTMKHSEDCQRDEPSSQGETDSVSRSLELHFEETNAEASHEAPSQSYEQFGIPMTTDSADLPSQSATKSENSREPTQSITYEPMETDEEAIVTEPPSQSFEPSKMNEASQSYETSVEESTNAPTQSFNELMQNQEERSTIDETIDDQAFPTQSYEVEKSENISENLETDAEISQEGNIPSQSNDVGADGIGTSSVSTNNSGLNEDETASSSYVPETPENQERDQDQESAISTSSYEIPPCEELNIASSSVIPDTSVRAEHTSIHDNGVPEIPTSSYNLNPDITSTHVDSVPTSSYEDQVIVEQNVSTSYEVPISMPGLEETCSQNFVTESTDHRNEPSSYYAHHQEVTASYYESVDQETNSRLEGDAQEEVTPSYYEGNPQEASQSYFNPEEATPSYSSHNVSPSYYDPRPESEASQSYYSTDDLEKTEQSSSQNIEASQSFYHEQSDELKLRQQGEATPTYTERYPVDYTLDSSPIDRHDLVESSVPATRPTER